MPQIQSQKKRVKTNNKRNLAVNAQKSALKTAIKNVLSAVEANDKAAANEALIAATKLIEMAGSKGIFHKNNVARKVSRLTKLVNTIA